MELHQIQVIYQPQEDRLLCRASFKAEGGLQEVRAWLTRRMVRQLWPGIIDVLERQVALDKPQAAHASADIVGMEHHASVEEIREKGCFSNAFESDVQAYPLGETPILIHQAQFTMVPNQPIRMNLTPEEGYGFEIAFDLTTLHGFCSLLKEAVRQADWDMKLAMPGSVAPAAASMLN